ncbi:MAG: glycogen synthase GlgA [Lachnospiraceae bacterium]
MKKKILFATSECVPFIKTGGLADVAGALPKAFDKEEFDVRVVLPNYRCIPDKYRNAFHYVGHFYLGLGGTLADTHCGIMTYQLDGITYYFIDNLYYFGGEKPYGDIRGDVEKFIFFSKAVLSILKTIDFRPDLIHCHDWQTGFIPVYLKNQFADDPYFRGIKTVFTIHNLKFQGIWDVKTIKKLSGFGDYLFTPDKLEYKKDANMLKGGLTYADYITTVSETYANEIQTPEYGEGMEGLLSARHFDMCGIVNGIDYEVYNPETDPKIYTNFSAEDWRKKKYKNKMKLQEDLGLPVDKNKYMIGLISRLTDQKGLDLINAVMEYIVDDNTQLVVIGTGESRYENMFRHYAWAKKGQVSANICYSDDLAHKLYAAADAFLMPSRFEPCGLTQLIAFRYGTVPIVRETGGLKDTIIPYNEYENTGDGFSFRNYDAGEMLKVINYSKKVFFETRRQWNQIVDRGMAKDFSWKVSMEKYAGIYRWLIG